MTRTKYINIAAACTIFLQNVAAESSKNKPVWLKECEGFKKEKNHEKKKEEKRAV